MSSKPGHRNMVTQYWSVDSFFGQLSIKRHNMDVHIKDAPVVIWTLLFLKVLALAYRRSDSHVTTKIFKINWLPNFLRYEAQLVHLHTRILDARGKFGSDKRNARVALGTVNQLWSLECSPNFLSTSW